MESCELAHSVVGTPLYMSPELRLSRPYDHKSDVWALGGVLYELTSLRRPFSAQGFAQLIMSVLRGRCAPIPLQARLPSFGTAAPRPRVCTCGAAKRHSCARVSVPCVQYSTDLQQLIFSMLKVESDRAPVNRCHRRPPFPRA
jgi:serine/threonine protein kinase